jgi:hypothetical protein
MTDVAPSPAPVPTHRFTLSPNIEDLLNALSAEGFPDLLRSDADIRWSRFMSDHETAISAERRRLAELGYRGDLGTKMFRSARYYRGAARRNTGQTAPRRAYIATPDTLLTQMDVHVQKHCFGPEPLSPAEGWSAFGEQHGLELTLAEQALTGTDRLIAADAQAKIKKAYKNRHFLQRRRRQQQALREAAMAAVPEDAA